MLKQRFRILIPLALGVASCTAYAQDLLDLYELGKETDPILGAAKQNQYADMEALPQARAQFFPIIAGNVSSNSNKTNSPEIGNYNTNSASISLSQPIFRFTDWLGYTQATYTVKRANATYAAAEQEYMSRLIDAYFNALKAKDQLHFQRAQRKAFERHLEQTKQRFKVGLIAITDVHEAQARLDSSYAEEILAGSTFDDQKEELTRIAGQSVTKLSNLINKLPLSSPNPADMNQWVERAVEQNLSLRAARYTAEINKETIQRQRTEHLPSLLLNGSVTRSTNGNSSVTPITGNTVKVTTRQFGLSLTVPIFTGGAITSKTREAIYRYHASINEVEERKRFIESSTRQSYRGVLTSVSEIKALQAAVSSSKSALNATTAGFESGTRTIIDVLDAQTSLLRAQKDLAIQRYVYIQNMKNLKLAAGTLCPDDLVKINTWLRG